MTDGHAPRERVSWNYNYYSLKILYYVTLHVSVWVEIVVDIFVKAIADVTLHVSVWVEIGDYTMTMFNITVTLHVSVWVEIWYWRGIRKNIRSRSTWACELKYPYRLRHQYLHYSHAPRERVSWNFSLLVFWPPMSCHAPRERVSWNIVIKNDIRFYCGHAPRERVSWNTSWET